MWSIYAVAGLVLLAVALYKLWQRSSSPQYARASSLPMTTMTCQRDLIDTSPPPSPGSSASESPKRQRMAIDGRRFWSNSVNRDMLRVARGQSYAGNMICLAPGLHVSKFSLDHDATVERLQNIVGGSLRPCSILCEPWKGVRDQTLAGVLRVLRLLDECAEGHLDLTRVCTVFYDSELPDTIESVRDSVIRAIARSAPVMLLSTGATEANLGERLVHGERLLFHLPAELLPVLSMYKALAAHQEDLINRQLASLASLPLNELQSMAGSTEAKKVLLAAVSHLSSRKRLAKFHKISLGKIKGAESTVDTALIQLGNLHDEVWTRLADERTRYLSEADKFHALVQSAREMGKASRVIQDLEHREKLHRRWAAIRDPHGPDFGPVFKRFWREAASKLDGLKHLPRGHRAPIHVKYPNFKEAVQSIAHDLNGRTDKGRSSATVYLGASTWAMIAERLADAAYMAKLGGVVPASVSALKQHKVRSARSKQRKCTDPSGQLNVSHRKVAKLLLPTAVEQPNGHMLNLTIKELERFGMLNAYYVDLVNRYALFFFCEATITREAQREYFFIGTTRQTSSSTMSIASGASSRSCCSTRAARSRMTTGSSIAMLTSAPPRLRRTTMSRRPATASLRPATRTCPLARPPLTCLLRPSHRRRLSGTRPCKRLAMPSSSSPRAVSSCSRRRHFSTLAICCGTSSSTASGTRPRGHRLRRRRRRSSR